MSADPLEAQLEHQHAIMMLMADVTFADYHGVLLRQTADDGSMVCDHCGPIAPADQVIPGRGGDDDVRFSYWRHEWIDVARHARDHVAEHPGHTVAIQQRRTAIYKSDADYVRPEPEG